MLPGETRVVQDPAVVRESREAAAQRAGKSSETLAAGSAAMSSVRIQPYQAQPARFHAYDPRYPEVAALLIEAIESQDRRLRVEHIGSTSVPECGGKGVLDLIVTYAEGDLEIAKSALSKLGFHAQGGRDPFAE